MRVLKLIENDANPAPLHLAREVAVVISNEPFYILLTNVSNISVHVARCMVVAHITDSKAPTIANETAVLGADPKRVVAVRYKPPVHTDTLMICHKNMEARVDQILKLSWKHEV